MPLIDPVPLTDPAALVPRWQSDARRREIEAALARGRQAVGQLTDHELVIASRSRTWCKTSPWVAAWLVLVRPSPPGDTAIEKARTYLRTTRREDGWGLHDDTESDVATTAAALLALSGTAHDDDERNAFEAHRERLVAASPRDIVATADTLALADRLGRPCATLEGDVGAFLRGHGLNCARRSHRFRSPFVFAARLAHWLGDVAPTDSDRASLAKALVWECLWRCREAETHALDAASVANCLTSLGPLSEAPDWPLSLDRLIDRVLRDQRSSGLWPARPLGFDEGGRALGSIRIGSEIALAALARYLALPSDALVRARHASPAWQEAMWQNPMKAPAQSKAREHPGTTTPRTRIDIFAQTLTTVEPERPPALISEEAHRNLCNVASQLPGDLTHGFGFESRLADRQQSVDLALCLSNTGEGGAILAGTHPDAALSDTLTARWPWRRVRRLAQAWEEAGNRLHRDLYEVWLEFDVAADLSGELPLPSVFTCLVRRPLDTDRPEEEARHARADRYTRTITSALDHLAPQRPENLDLNLRRTLRALPASATPYAIGTMLARRTQAIRLCFQGIPPGEISAFLRAIEWPGDHAAAGALLDDLCPLVDRAHVDLDLSDALLPTLGLECFYDDRRPPALEPRWARFVDWLVAEGLCLPDKGEALLAWPGRLHAFEQFSETSITESYFDKILGHVKVTLTPDGRRSAKGYFGAWRAFSRTATTKDESRA